MAGIEHAFVGAFPYEASIDLNKSMEAIINPLRYSGTIKYTNENLKLSENGILLVTQ